MGLVLRRGSLVLVAAGAAAACVQFPEEPADPATPDAWVSPWGQDSGGTKLIKPLADGHFNPDGGAPTPDAWVPSFVDSVSSGWWHGAARVGS